MHSLRPMETQTGKKKGRSFSLTDKELSRIEKRSTVHGFADRNEYLLALLEADERLELEAKLDENRRRVLRPSILSPQTNREKMLSDSISALGKLLESMKGLRDGNGVPSSNTGCNVSTPKHLHGQNPSGAALGGYGQRQIEC